VKTTCVLTSTPKRQEPVRLNAAINDHSTTKVDPIRTSYLPNRALPWSQLHLKDVLIWPAAQPPTESSPPSGAGERVLGGRTDRARSARPQSVHFPSAFLKGLSHVVV